MNKVVEKCFKCGATDKKLIVHHLSYRPEKTVLCCWSCHKSIHIKIRKAGKCKYTPEEIYVLSTNSSSRRNRTKYRKQIKFIQTIGENVRLFESVDYLKSGKVCVSSCFQGDHGKKLYNIYEDKQQIWLQEERF